MTARDQTIVMACVVDVPTLETPRPFDLSAHYARDIKSA